ncbi:MAG: hypothetical protein P9L94_05075 [Candidatus Hinthialibacter antarcticus]|nr:hypothetical protein [Candidatus Hinthialibacter antarcticus]
MFTQVWREYWGLLEDPFTCEDADKDGVLPDVDPNAVHWSFDRLYGTPRMPAPAIIFGEKGSGKSALRLMMRRKVEKHNQDKPDEKLFLIEYIDFNNYLSHFRRAIGARNDEQAAERVMKRWGVAEHLDCLLSLGVSKLVDEVLPSESPRDKLNHKQRAYLALMASIYYDSSQRTQMEAVHQLISRLGLGSLRPYFYWMLTILMTVASFFLAALPIAANVNRAAEQSPMPVLPFLIGGGVLLAGAWLPFMYYTWMSSSFAARADRAVKSLPRNSAALNELLKRLPLKERREYTIPRGSDEAGRYQLLQRFIEILHAFGYKGVYVLLDRIDEPSLISGREDSMRKFVESLLDIKLLQFPDMGLKLFLPIEMDEIHRNATPEQLKKMRLDKSNLVPELKWTGQELYEIANQRVKSCVKPDGRIQGLADIFGDDFDFAYLKETLHNLGTPRYAFGFLSTLFSEYTKNLPNELGDGDPRWQISRAHFDVVKAGWTDRSDVMRRVLN